MELDFLQTDKSIQNETNSVGFAGALESDIYDFVVDMAYFDKSRGGANSLNLVLKTKNGEMLKNQVWITSGTAKGCKNYYERDGVKSYLPGFNQANAMCMLSIGKEISALKPEEKKIKVFSFASMKEELVDKMVLTELLGAEISCGVIKQIVDKNVKNDAGEYVPSGKTRNENEIDKCFRTSDGMTVAELRDGSKNPEFKEKWLEKNKGETKDKSSGVATPSVPGAATSGAAPETAGDDLFDEDD